MSTDQIVAAKRALRAATKQQLAAVSPEDRQASSNRALENLLDRPDFWEADLVLAFLSMPDEIDTNALIDKILGLGKEVAVPRITNDTIDFVLLPENWRSWPLDRWQIPSPPAGLPALGPGQINQADCLVLVPGLAFDRQGNRLGRGKGYYDRFLGLLHTEREKLEDTGSLSIWGYCYERQLMDEVPVSDNDQPVDDVICG